jgi:hypothetical protein
LWKTDVLEIDVPNKVIDQVDNRPKGKRWNDFEQTLLVEYTGVLIFLQKQRARDDHKKGNGKTGEAVDPIGIIPIESIEIIAI